MKREHEAIVEVRGTAAACNRSVAANLDVAAIAEDTALSRTACLTFVTGMGKKGASALKGERGNDLDKQTSSAKQEAEIRRDLRAGSGSAEACQAGFRLKLPLNNSHAGSLTSWLWPRVRMGPGCRKLPLVTMDGVATAALWRHAGLVQPAMSGPHDGYPDGCSGADSRPLEGNAARHARSTPISSISTH